MVVYSENQSKLFPAMNHSSNDVMF